MRNIFLMVSLFLFLSCEENKMEFIQSRTMVHVFLIKNPSQNSLLKENINIFLIKNPSIFKNENHIGFYKYSSNTKYFINHLPDSGGFSSEELSNYPEDELATFIISKCENDTTKLVGELFFYGLKGSSDGIRETDTIIYKCN